MDHTTLVKRLKLVSNKTNKPRHCMVVDACFPLGETRVQREAEALIRNGYEVEVVCIRLPHEMGKDEYKSIKIYREAYQLPFGLSRGNTIRDKFLRYLCFFITAGVRLTLLHLRNPYKSIQVHNLPDFLIFCALIPRMLGIPVILDLHDLMPEFFAGRFGYSTSLIGRLICLQERLACQFATHVITVSDHWRQILIKRGIPANKVSVVMNVADGAIFHLRKEKNACNKPSEQFRLIYHGSLHQRYGIDLAVRAIAQLRSAIPGIHFVIVGTGPFLLYLQSLVNDLNLTDHVSFEPMRLVEELPDIIQNCNLGIVPYQSDIFTDGLVPTKMMEYAAMELPIVAARTTGIQAYFNGSNVEFFEPGNLDDLVRTILKLYLNPGRMISLAQRSKYFNNQYNWMKIGANYVALINRYSDRKHELLTS